MISIYIDHQIISRLCRLSYDTLPAYNIPALEKHTMKTPVKEETPHSILSVIHAPSAKHLLTNTHREGGFHM